MLVIIDNYDSFTYNLFQKAATCCSVIYVFRNDECTVEEIEALKPSKIIISPGPKAPVDAGICIELIKTLAPKVPILGVCLGMQAIGEAFGAKVILTELPIHGRSSLIYHSGKGLYSNMPMPFEAGRYHSLMVEKQSLPQTLQIEAETSDGLIMGLRHRDYDCYGVQFHPESILTPEGDRLIENFLNSNSLEE